MFNKEESHNVIKAIIKENIDLKEKKDYFISSDFILMVNYALENKLMNEQIAFENKKTAYIKRRYEYSQKKQYDKRIIELCQNGKLIVNKKTYNLSTIYLTYNNDNNFQLIETDDNKNILNNNDINYNYKGVIKFVDTTSFIKLINHPEISVRNYTVVVQDKDILVQIISNWDGYIHNMTKETDAIIDKNILRRIYAE